MIQPNLEYRPDIDGLRAIAVLGVIFYHVQIGALSGGFVGVDVFFVLSGYLITQRIVAGHERGGFNYLNFYARRVRRLLPAVLSTTAGSVIAGLFLLHPYDLVELSFASIAAIFSVANIWFFLDSGYWEASLWLKPLLHTWSLSVEEQFYALWPLAIVGILSLSKKRSFGVLMTITAMSLALTTFYTTINSDAAFYLTPFRIYEFGLGALCVWFDSSRRMEIFSATYGSFLLAVGLIVIGGSFALIDESQNFPGWIATIPAIGTALIILARNPVTVGHLLCNPCVLYLGKISYSLYLVHWPVLVFFKIHFGTLDTKTILNVLACSFALSSIQYHFIEAPLRTPKSSRVSKVTPLGAFVIAGIATALTSAAAISIILQHGLPGRYDQQIQSYASLDKKDFNAERSRLKRSICASQLAPKICGKFDKIGVNFLVVGDSHGVDGINAMAASFPEGNLLVATQGGCPMVLSLSGVTHAYRDCETHNQQRLNFIERNADKIDFVVFSQRLSMKRVDTMLKTFDWLKERGMKIIVFGAGPQFREPVVPMILEHGTIMGLDEALHGKAVTEHYEADDIMAPHVERLGGIYVTKRKVLCPKGVCRIILSGGQPLMYDTHHLSPEAAMKLSVHLSARFRGLTPAAVAGQ